MEDEDHESLENLANLKNGNAILDVIQNRYNAGRIYTLVGSSLLAFNPNRQLEIYDIPTVDQYLNGGPFSDRAHVFSIACSALGSIQNGSKAEAILLSGNSGSGKTTNAFHLMRFLTTEARSKKINCDHINAVEVILNRLASAKTLKNENSTRCGYSVQFLYKSGILQGFKVDSVLPLELSRLILQRNGEKSFSVFYQLCAGLSYDERGKFGINDAKQYFYLNQGRNNSSTQIEADLFREFNSALKTIGFSDHQRGLIYKLLSSILHLGNIYFRTSMISDGSEVVELANEAELKWVAHLLEIDVDDLKQLFLTQAEPVKPENEYEEPPRPKLVPISSVDKALDIRDSFAKTLYKELFKWVLNHISMFFEAPQYDGQISIVDAYGFERYTFNGFEEFCVNVINEQLHNVFIQKVFKSFQRDYEDEGIACDYRMPSHLDNERVVGMLSYRPCGLVPLLNDECRFPKGSDQAFFQRASINHLDKSIFAKPRTKDRFEFGIKHFAGMTYYCVDGFLQKNQWTEIGAVKELLSQSNDPAIAYMNQKSGEVADKKIYISDEFVKAVDILSEKLLKERIQFVRCIRVNNDRSRSVFDPELVGKQMKALEIQENYRMSHFGFSCKYSFEEFIKRYRCLLPIEVISYDKPQRIVTDILTGQGSKFDSDYAVGVHSIFMKERLIKQLDTAKHALRDSSALVIQRNLRMHQARKAFKKKKAAAIKLQAAVRGWSARRETENLKREEIEKIELPLLPPPPPPPLAEEEIIFPTATINFFEIPEEVAKITEKKVEVGKVKTITTYLPFELQLEKPEVESMMIEEFAELYLKNHILEARREPVLTPFLPKDTEEDFQLSLVLFKLILKYMNDSTLRAGQRSLLAKYIMQQGIENLNQRDEIYVQLCNQTYNNKNPESTRSAWNLISMAVNSFPPGILVFPMLVDYFEKQPEPLSTILLEGLLRPLRHADTHKNRLFAPTVLEQLSLNRRQPTILQISLPGGDSVDVEVDAWTTAEEIVDRVLRLRGLTDADGWGIEIENSEINGIVSGQNFIFDALSQFEEPRARVDQSPFVNFKTFAKSDPRNSADPEGTDGKPDIDTESLKKSISILKSNSKPRMTPEEYANMSVATRIRNMKIPGNNGDVNRFLDEVFDQVLPPNEEITPAALASTIKGGISHEIYYHRPESSDHYIPHRQQRQLPRFYDNYNRRVPSGLSSINLSDGGRDSRFSSNPPSRQLYSPPFRTSYQRRSSSMSPENEQASRMHTNGNVNLDDYYENAPGTRPSTTTRRDSSPRMRTPSNGYEQSADSSYFDNSLPTSNIRQIIRRFESPVAERRARALSSRSKSTPREFSTYNSDVPHPAPAPDYEQEEIVDVRSPRQFRSPDYPRSVSSTPRLPRTSPGRFPMINPEGDPRSAREEAARKLRRNAEEVPPFVFREELKSPMTLDSRQESPLLSRNGTSAYSKPPIPQPPISRSRSGTANGFHNGVSNGNGMMSNGKSNGVQKTRSGGYWAYDGEVDQGNAYMSHPADIPELSAAPSRNSPLVSAASRNGYPTSAASRNSPFASVASRNDPLASATSVTSIKSGATSGSSPATGYVNEPWKLTIRREVFYPGEKLDDIDSIDLVFSQIITDCRKSNPHRIRQFERDRINYILNKYQVPVELLDRVNEISVKIKNEIINEVRKWPLYFCRMYSVIKEQENGGLFMILAIGENGIRLMTRNVENSDDPMVPQGHFDFSDITDVIYEPTSTLKILTTTQTTKLTCKQAQQAAEFILRFLENTPKRKTFVTATVDYQTKESNLLSFRCGDIIQVVKENKQDKPPAAGKWLYGKIGNRFGWFPVEYVQPTTAESEYGSEIYTPSVANNNHALSPQFKSNTDILHRTTRGPENPLGPSQRSKSLDNRRDFEPGPDDDLSYDRSLERNSTLHASMPRRRQRSGTGGDFFNETITIPTRQTGRTGSKQFASQRAEAADDDWTSYDRKVRYEHERTTYPVSPPRRERYYDEGYSYRSPPAYQPQGISPRSAASRYPESEYYHRSQKIQQHRPLDYTRSADAQSGYQRETLERGADYRYFDDESAAVAPAHRAAASAAEAARSTGGGGGGHRRYEYHYESHGGPGGARYGYSNGGGYYREKRSGFWGGGRRKEPRVYHRVHCCCFSFKWPPFAYEECEPPRPMYPKPPKGSPGNPPPPQQY